MIESVADFVLILREVHFHFRLHVEGDQRDVILRLKVWKERIGPVLCQIRKSSVVTCAEFHHDHHGDGSFGGAKIGDGLRNAVFEKTKIFAIEPGDDVAVTGGGDYVHGDNWNFDGDRQAGFWWFLLWWGRSLSRRRRGLRLAAGLRPGGRLCSKNRHAK